MRFLFSLVLPFVCLFVCVSGAVRSEDAVPRKGLNVGKIMFVGSCVDYENCTRGAVPDFSWLWHLHAILSDNHVEHEFVGVAPLEDWLCGDLISQGGVKSARLIESAGNSWRYHMPSEYAGKAFVGRVSSAGGLRLSEISGRKKDKGRLGNTDIEDWLRLDKTYKGVFQLAEEDLPDVVILMAGMQDLLIDSGFLETKNYRMHDSSLLKKAHKQLLGNARVPMDRSKADMDVVLRSIRRACPEARVMVLPILPYSVEIYVPIGQVSLSNDRRERLSKGDGWNPKQIREIKEAIDAYNEALKKWAESRSVEFVDVRPGMCVGFQTSPVSKKYKTVCHGYINIRNFTPMQPETRLIAHQVAAALGSAGGTDGLPRLSSKNFSLMTHKEIRRDKKYPGKGTELYRLKFPTKGDYRKMGLTLTMRFSAGSMSEYEECKKKGYPLHKPALGVYGVHISACGIRVSMFDKQICYQGCLSDCRDELRYVWESCDPTGKHPEVGVARLWLGDKLLSRKQFTMTNTAEGLWVERDLNKEGSITEVRFTYGAYAPPAVVPPSASEKKMATDAD